MRITMETALLLSAELLLFGGCRKTVETSAGTEAPPAARPAPAPTQRQHHACMNGMSPLIVSMSPDTISIGDGRGLTQPFSLTYEIDKAEKATKAAISVYAEGVGELQRFDVEVQPSGVQSRGEIEFLLDASSRDLGPTVRFRVSCPAGDTDWYPMGILPAGASSQISTPQIGNVTPGYIAAGSSRPAGTGVPVTIWGAHFTRACKPEATVDGTSIELKNVLILNNEIRALLLYSDLQGRPVSARYLSVNLEVTSTTGYICADSFRLNFKD